MFCRTWSWLILLQWKDYQYCLTTRIPNFCNLNVDDIWSILWDGWFKRGFACVTSCYPQRLQLSYGHLCLLHDPCVNCGLLYCYGDPHGWMIGDVYTINDPLQLETWNKRILGFELVEGNLEVEQHKSLRLQVSES